MTSETPKTSPKKSYVRPLILLGVLGLAAVFFLFYNKTEKAVVTPIAKPQPKPVAAPAPPPPEKVIDYKNLAQPSETTQEMDQRKEALGVGKGIDIIAKPEESIKVGDATIPMQTIIDKIKIKQGEIIDKSTDTTPSGKDEEALLRSKAYGIYVVQPGDNIWNIHFRFLQDYFQRRGVTLSPASDEPDKEGRSSGVAKVLKFSENMVHIYNITEKKLDVDINLIVPLSKIVVYNMKQVFSLLDSIDTSKVNRIQFDGETLWIQADENGKG